MEELITRRQLAEIFGVTEGTVDGWRYGRGGINAPLPYFRFANKVWLWRGGIIWWINKLRERPDAYHIDRMRRLEKGIKVGRPRSRRNSK